MIQFKDLPVEIQQRMLDEQVRQGNKRDAKVFEIDYTVRKSRGAFFGLILWRALVSGQKYCLRATLPIFTKNTPNLNKLQIERLI